MNGLRKTRHFLFFIFLGMIIVGLFLSPLLGLEISIEEFQALLPTFGIWFPIAFIVIYALATMFIPSTPLMVLSGLLFGFKYGLLYTIIAGLLSAVICFFIARFLGKDFIEGLLKERFLQKLSVYEKRIAKRGIVTTIILRITPIIPFNVLNFLMGISTVSFKDYLIGTVIGLAPSNVLAVYLGGLY